MHHSYATYSCRCIYSLTYSTAMPWHRSEDRAVAGTTGAGVPTTCRTPACTGDIPARTIVFGPSVTDGPSGKSFSTRVHLYSPDASATRDRVHERSAGLLPPCSAAVSPGVPEEALGESGTMGNAAAPIRPAESIPFSAMSQALTACVHNERKSSCSTSFYT